MNAFTIATINIKSFTRHARSLYFIIRIREPVGNVGPVDYMDYSLLILSITSILAYGSFIEPFRPSKDITQCDLLIYFLFIIVVEVLVRITR